MDITTTSPLPNATIGNPYSETLVAAAGVPPYTWAITGGTLPVGLVLNPVTGEIFGHPTVAGPVAFMVTATDSAGATALKAFTIAVDPAPLPPPPPPALVITTAPVPAATEGVALTHPLNATGGVPPYTWVLTGNPPWLTVNPAGNLVGTPPAGSAGNVAIVTTVTDSTGALAHQPLVFTVDPAAPPPPPPVPPLAVTPGALPPATQHVAYNHTFVGTGGVAPYAWTLHGAPGWLSIDPATGQITGTPGGHGTVNFTVGLEDSSVPTHQIVFLPVSLTVNPAPHGGGTRWGRIAAIAGAVIGGLVLLGLCAFLVLAAASLLGPVPGGPPSGGGSAPHTVVGNIQPPQMPGFVFDPSQSGDRTFHYRSLTEQPVKVPDDFYADTYKTPPGASGPTGIRPGTVMTVDEFTLKHKSLFGQ